jgi:Ser/Thr protein kinase RdoA (MazF antagonist)/predicted nucleotidyltransferase
MQKRYSPKERTQILDLITEESRKNDAFVGCVLVGSGSFGFSDEYSDIDILVVVDDQLDMAHVSGTWKDHLDTLLPVMAYAEVPRADRIILHNFYLANYLEINNCVLPLELLSATKANYRVLWDRTGRIRDILDTTWQENCRRDPLRSYFAQRMDGIWHYVNHGFVAIRRGKPWQALSDIEEIRQQIIHLHAYRNRLEPKRNRDVDRMDRAFLERLESLMVASASAELLMSKLNLATRMFFDESKEVCRELGTGYDYTDLEAELLELIETGSAKLLARQPPVDVFPVQDSTASAEALTKSMLKRYDLPQPVACVFHRKGICDTYRITAGDRGYYLKVYRASRRSRTDVTEEVRLLNHLATGGVSVAEPIMRRDGRYVNQIAAPEGTRYWVLFEAAQGVPDDDGDHVRIKSLGEMVGRMHQCADKMPLPYRRCHLDMDHLVNDNLSVIAPMAAHRSNDLTLIRRIAVECQDRISQLLPTAKPEYGICHGDLHGGDVCYDTDNRPTLFDFDSSGEGWRALDIGVHLASDDWMAVTDEADERRRRRMAAFIEGYSSVRELTEGELVALQLGPPIRHIFLMGHVLRYTAIYEGEHWANDEFIDWHMKWFEHWAQTHL